jgi:hypothetical protein
MVRFTPWSSETKGPFPPPVYISHIITLITYLSAYHVTSSRLSLGLRVYSTSSPLFFDPVSLLMAYQHYTVPTPTRVTVSLQLTS